MALRVLLRRHERVARRRAIVHNGSRPRLNTAPVNSVAVANVPDARAGTASGLVNAARMIGATFGVAILGAVFAHAAGQSETASDFLAGLRRALGVGGTAELAGAVLALCFIGRDSGHATRRDGHR